MKWLMKLFIPSPAELAKMAAEKLADAVNESGKTDTIAKYSLILRSTAANVANANEMLTDGKIDPNETELIAEMLTPYFERVLEMI